MRLRGGISSTIALDRQTFELFREGLLGRNLNLAQALLLADRRSASEAGPLGHCFVMVA
jgi:hypothetical protein